MINMYNARSFLEEGKFETTAQAQARGEPKQAALVFNRTAIKPPGKSVPYMVTDKPPAKVGCCFVACFRRGPCPRDACCNPAACMVVAKASRSAGACTEGVLLARLGWARASGHCSTLASARSLDKPVAAASHCSFAQGSPDWHRVVAVIVQGAKWQFKDWTFFKVGGAGGLGGICSCSCLFLTLLLRLLFAAPSSCWACHARATTHVAAAVALPARALQGAAEGELLETFNHVAGFFMHFQDEKVRVGKSLCHDLRDGVQTGIAGCCVHFQGARKQGP